MNTSQSAIGQRLRQIRKANKYSGQALGELIGVSKSAVSLIESGANKLSYEYALIISKHFGVDVDWLLTGEGKGSQATQHAQAGRDIGVQAGRDVHHSGKGSDCEQRLEAALREIELLRERIKDKEQLIELLLKR